LPIEPEPAVPSEPPLLFAVGLFLLVLGLLIAVVTPWLAARLGSPRLPLTRRPRTAPRHKAGAPARAT